MAARWNSSRAPAEASQTHALEAMVGLQVCEAHFDPLPLIAGLSRTPAFP